MRSTFVVLLFLILDLRSAISLSSSCRTSDFHTSTCLLWSHWSVGRQTVDSSKDLPAYEKPPVNEVVCGFTFHPLEKLLAPHLGLLWLKFKSDYPICQEVPPLTPTIERLDDGPPEAAFELHEVPPLPRIWFVHSTDNGVLQVQRDRFLHNWRKVREDDEYPRYHSVKQMFQEKFGIFQVFLKENELGEVRLRQCEMTYINHIPMGHGWSSPKDIGQLFPDFVWRTSEKRFLNSLSELHWKSAFLLPEKQGRLHATIRQGKRKRDQQPIVLFELTARGVPADATGGNVWNWFDLAHQWIVHGFADLTDSKVQSEIWKRKR